MNKRPQTISCQRGESPEWLYVPNEEYFDYGNCKRYLQMIIPYREKWTNDEKFPVIMFVPGSAWYRQEMFNSLPKRVELAKAGIIVVDVQYRESTIAKFPAQIEDMVNALHHLSKISSTFHMDLDRVFLAGDSSGAHVALIAGLSMWNNHFNLDLGSSLINTIKGLILLSTPTNLFFSKGNGPIENLLGLNTVNDNAILTESASCTKYIDSDKLVPPMIMFHGTNDNLVSIRHSRYLYDLLIEHNKKVEYYEIEDAGHGGACFWSSPVIDLIHSFVERH